MLFFAGGTHCGRAAAAEPMRAELDLVQWCCAEAEGQDEKASRHTGCPATLGRTLPQTKIYAHMKPFDFVSRKKITRFMQWMSQDYR